MLWPDAIIGIEFRDDGAALWLAGGSIVLTPLKVAAVVTIVNAGRAAEAAP